MRKLGKSIASFFAVSLLIVSLLPLLGLSKYAAPASDDFGYSAPVYYAIENGEGLFGVIKALVENIKYTYYNWQGTFTSVFLFSLQPGIFGEEFYFLTPFILLAIIIAPIYIAVSSIRGLSAWGKLVIGSVISVLAVQYMPSIADGIYWWNGAAHYLVLWSLLVLVVVCQIDLSRHTATEKTFALRAVVASAGAFLIGGGNYSAALISAVILVAIAGYNMLQKKHRSVLLVNCAAVFLNLAGLLISCIAPGNAIRQAGFGKMSAITAILKSFSDAAKAVITFSDLKMLCALLISIPVFLASAKSMKYSFRYPLVVVAGAFCVFAAMYTPPLYAMGISDVPRMNNIFYMGYLGWAFISAFYIAGWVSRRVEINLCGTRILSAVGAIGTLAFCIIFAVQITSSNAYLAYSDLSSGAAETYLQERAARTKAYENKDLTKRFVPITEYPECFITANHLTWASDLIVNGVVSDLALYRACGGEVTFVGLQDALEFFDCGIELTKDDFSKVYYVDKKTCIPLREFTEKNGYTISYDTLCDTIYIVTEY